MPHTQSTALALGAPAPDFSLPDVTSGEIVTLDRFSGSHALLVMFLCHIVRTYNIFRTNWRGLGAIMPRVGLGS